MEHAALLAIVSIILAMVSILQGILSVLYTIRSSKLQSHSFREILQGGQIMLDRIKEVELELSTVRIGKFPQHIRNICDVLRQAEESIFIACQAAGYGSSTAPELYADYEYVIKQKALAGVSISILVPCRRTMEIYRERQFGDYSKDWGERAKQEGFIRVLAGLQKRTGAKAPASSYEEFKASVALENNLSLNVLSGFAALGEVDHFMSIQMWVADKQRAVFSISSYDGATVSNAFETRDAELIASLISTWHYYAESPK